MVGVLVNICKINAYPTCSSLHTFGRGVKITPCSVLTQHSLPIPENPFDVLQHLPLQLQLFFFFFFLTLFCFLAFIYVGFFSLICLKRKINTPFSAARSSRESKHLQPGERGTRHTGPVEVSGCVPYDVCLIISFMSRWNRKQKNHMDLQRLISGACSSAME